MTSIKRLAAVPLAAGALCLTSGFAVADVTESGDTYTKMTARTSTDGAAVDEGAARNDIGTISKPADRVDVGALRNDVGPVAPAEPETSPVSTGGIDPDQVIGWTAAGVGAAAALLAGGMFLRRRHGHLVHPA